MFDHPKTPRYPTTWHVRFYGLFAANPFGLHDFEKKPAGAGNLAIPPHQSVTFRYRFYLHEGDEEQAGSARRYKEWGSSQETPPRHPHFIFIMKTLNRRTVLPFPAPP